MLGIELKHSFVSSSLFHIGIIIEIRIVIRPLNICYIKLIHICYMFKKTIQFTITI